MISEAEIKTLVQDVTQSFVSYSFDNAFTRLQDIFIHHIQSESVDVEITNLTEMIDIVRNHYGIAGKAGALIGINAAENLYKKPSNIESEEFSQYTKMRTLLQIGRLIFNGKGDAEKLHNVMRTNFNTKQENIYRPSMRM